MQGFDGYEASLWKLVWNQCEIVESLSGGCGGGMYKYVYNMYMLYRFNREL